MNWFNRHLSWTALLAIVAFLAITLSISIWVGEEEGWILFGAIPAALVGYIFGDIRGTSKVGKPERVAKEEARYMIDAGQICVAEKVDRNHGMTYGAEKFSRVHEILKSEARRHKTEAEEEEKLLSDLLNLLERPESKTE